jgi:hypothetical protein
MQILKAGLQNCLRPKLISLLAALILLSQSVPSSALAGYATKYDLQRDEAAEEAEAILVQHGLCKSPELCAGQTLFISEDLGGLEVELYGVADQQAIGEVAQGFLRTFSKTPSMESTSIRAYAFSMNDAGSTPFLKRWEEGATFDVNMKRK